MPLANGARRVAHRFHPLENGHRFRKVAVPGVRRCQVVRVEFIAQPVLVESGRDGRPRG